MSWLKIQFDLGDIEPEQVEQALLEIGAVSIEYRDGGDKPIIEPEPGTSPLWEKVRIAALFGKDTDETTIFLTIANSVAPASMPKIEFSTVEARDWVADFQQDLQPMKFGSHLWVCPLDVPCPDAQGISIAMEPGLGFGTGSHPTTAMCLDWLAGQPLLNKTVLDYGCGSGILSIAALALGARRATGVDIDAQARQATRENARRNQCLELLQICPATGADSAEKFDLIVANILSGTLIDLESEIRRHCRSGTKIALSGILTSQTVDVSTAYEHWVDLDPLENRREWAILGGTVA
jgi:ribosomal protein L11 methyltransferase